MHNVKKKNPQTYIIHNESHNMKSEESESYVFKIRCKLIVRHECEVHGTFLQAWTQSGSHYRPPGEKVAHWEEMNKAQ